MRKFVFCLFFAVVLLVITNISGTVSAPNLDPLDYNPSDFPLDEPQQVEVRTLLLLDMNQELDPLSITDYRNILKRAAAAIKRDYGVEPVFKIENYIMPRKQFLGARYRDLCVRDYATLAVPKSKREIIDSYFKDIPETEYCYYNLDYFKLHLRQIPVDVTLTNYLLLDPSASTPNDIVAGADTPVSASKFLESTLLSVFPYIGRYNFLEDDPRRLIPAEERKDKLAYEIARRLSRTMLHLGEVDSGNCIMSKDKDVAYAAFMGDNGGDKCSSFTRSLDWDITYLGELLAARKYAAASKKTERIRETNYGDTRLGIVLDIFAVVLSNKPGGKKGIANECGGIKNISDEKKLEREFAGIERYIESARSICNKQSQ